MRKRIISILVVIAFLIPLVLVGKSITIKKIGNKKSAVTFNHTKHKKYQFKGRKVKCKDCHHKGKMKDSCGKKGCHSKTLKTKSGKKLTGKKAIHINCINQCHKAQKKGPVKYKACHKK